MDKRDIIELSDIVEGVLVTNPRDFEGVPRIDGAYAYDDHVVADVVQWGEKVSWIAEVTVLTDRMPCEVRDVGYRMSTDKGETWGKARGRPPAALRLRGERMHGHIVGLRNAARFSTRAQGRDAVAALRDLLDAVRSGDESQIADGVRRAQALLSALTPEVKAPCTAS